nr:cytochrome P450 [Pharsalia antennata]
MLCRQVKNVFFVQFSKARLASYSAVLDFQDIPSPKGWPLVGTTFSLLAAGGPPKLHEYMDRRHKQLGPIFKDNVGPVTAVFLSDAEEMRNVFAQEGKYPVHIKPEPWLVYNAKHHYTRGLFFMDGEEWLKFRKVMNKLLLRGDLSWIEDSCEAASDLLLKRIKFYGEKNAEFPDLEKQLYKWSMDVIIAVLLGPNTFKKNCEVLQPYLDKLAENVQLVFQTTSKLMLLPANLAEKYNIPPWKRFERSVKTALESANEIVQILRNKFHSGDGLLSKMERETIATADINRIVEDLILGGGDTTTYTMEWMLYLISKNKEVQERLRQDDKTLTKNILRETLRLYPVAPFLTRVLPHAAVVGGYSIPAGTLIVMSIYTSGRDERYYKNPALFLPDRWVRNSTHSTVNQQASLPFGIGARSCIGKKIAEAQLQVTLSKIVRNFDVNLCNQRDVEIILKLVAKPSDPLRLKFNKI